MQKKLENTGHRIFDKMQVTTILNSLPLSWEHIITTLTHSGKGMSMVSLPILLILEERMKRREGGLMVTQALNTQIP